MTREDGQHSAKKDGGSWLVTQMNETGVSNNHLAWGMGVSRRLVQHWREGRPPSKEQRNEIELFFSAKRECLKGRVPHAHPHRRFLHKLEQAAGAGISCEVLGLPGMFKSALLADLEHRLKNSGRVRHFFFHNLGKESDIDQFWNSIGRNVIGDRKRSFSFEEVKEKMQEKAWVLLLDDADLFLSNVEQKYSNRPHEFRPIGSQWIKNVLSLPGSKILTSTIASADFISLVAGGSPCIFPTLEFSQWFSRPDWEFWTALLADNVHRKVKEIEEKATNIPLVFREGLRSLQTPHLYPDVGVVIKQIQDNIAKSIWARLPVNSRDALVRDNFELPNNSTLFEAFYKSGITNAKTGSLSESLKVPGWLTTWKMGAGFTK